MTVAGRLTGTLDGLPVSITASERGILLALGGPRGLLSLLRSAGRSRPVLGPLTAAGIPFVVRFAGVTIPVLPRPHWLVRLLVP